MSVIKAFLFIGIKDISSEIRFDEQYTICNQKDVIKSVRCKKLNRFWIMKCKITVTDTVLSG